MHITVLASSPDAAQKLATVLNNKADRCTAAASWAELFASLERNTPDIVLVERAALAHAELASLLRLAQPGRWPPILLIGFGSGEIETGLAAARRLAENAPASIAVGDLRIDTRRKRATIGDRWVALPPIQYRLLLTLARHAGEVIGSRELLREVWGYEASQIEARELVKVHIGQIRRRLGLDREAHHYIHSVRGFGYMLAPPEDDEAST